ncbi:MAG: dihydrofolate reductase family protein [Balneolaceae bacterium]
MRKIIYAQLVSLDGYIEDRNGRIDWTKPGEELHRHFNEMERNLDINFYGRKMSEVMDFWLTADQNPDLQDYEIEYARLWQETERIVFSKTLDKVEGNAQIRREVNPDEIRELKSQPGNHLGVGGAGLASTFIKHGLVDEFRLYIHPVAIGGGKPMFPIGEKLDLEFVETETFPGGVVMATYRLADG